MRKISPRYNGIRPLGFTLVELLVVIAIFGVLVALLLPAVQAARESARRSQCVTNLRQVGVALQNYESAKRVLPYGSDYYDVTAGPTFKATWAALILPYLEEQSLYDRFDFTLPMRNAKNQLARETPVSTYICPSD